MKMLEWGHTQVSAVFILVLVLFSFVPSPPAFAQECTDEGVKKGVRLYDDGKFPQAMQELKNAVKRLQRAPKNQSVSDCVFKANIFIGMAYLGTGKESDAKEYFLHAAKAVPGKTLSGPEYADYATPKALSLYDTARKQVPIPASASPAAAPTPATSTPSASVPAKSTSAVSSLPSALTIRSIESGAEVLIDGVKQGKTPIKIVGMAPGRHTVQVVHGTQKREQTYMLEPGKELETTFDFKNSGHILISSSPGEADIYLDGLLLAAKTPALIKDISGGEHVVRITKDGFAESTQKVSVKADKVSNINVRLKQMTYTVKITSVPSGADVLWDNVAQGKTPLSIGGVMPGAYTVHLTKENFETEVDAVEVKNGPVEREYTLRGQMGTVSIVTSPAGAEAFVDGKYEGLTPLQKKYAPKSYSLRLKKEGVEKSLAFTIIGGRETKVNETLSVEEARKEAERKKRETAKQKLEKERQRIQGEAAAALKKKEEARRLREEENRKKLEQPQR